MAKVKMKKCPFDTKASEMRPGIWQWAVGKRQWEWHVAPGLNTLLLSDDGPVGMAWHEKLEHAVCFSWGYDTGVLAEVKANARKLLDKEGPANG